MKKVLFSAALLTSMIIGALTIQSSEAQDVLGKWVSVYHGGSEPYEQGCYQSSVDECVIGDTRAPQKIKVAY